jgi:hypothetical protein
MQVTVGFAYRVLQTGHPTLKLNIFAKTHIMALKNIPEKPFSLIVFGITAIVLVILSFLTEGNYGGTDNFNHYFLSLSAWKQPHLFLDAWGRPLYTILSAPFALLGYEAVKLFNVMLGLLTAWFAYLTAKRLDIKPSWIVFLFVCFTPIYIVMLYTALTEILFSFVLVLSVYLFFREKYIFSAIVISFLPFARTEGYVLIPFLGLALLMRKQWKAIPFLAFGFLLFCSIGSFYYKDFFWPITKFPYPVTHGHAIYKETGSLWHFLVAREFIIGLPLELLFLGGLIQLIRECFSKDQAVRSKAIFLIILVLAPFITYLAFHSVLWWKAMGGSMGLVRVMAAVMPLAALVSIKGYAMIDKIFGNWFWLRVILAVVIIFFMVRAAVVIHEIPVKPDQEEATIKRSAKWLRESPYYGRPFYFTCLDFPFFYGENANDPLQCNCAWFFFTRNLDPLPQGAILIWDAHFGPNENQVPLDSVLMRPDLKLVNVLRPEKEWTTYGGLNYEVYMVEKVPPGTVFSNKAIFDSIMAAEAAKFKLVRIYRFDFETSHAGIDQKRYSRDVALSGKQSLKIDSTCEFSPGLFRKASELTGKSEGIQLWSSVSVYSDTSFSINQATLVISVEDKHGSYYYRSVSFETLQLLPGQWNTIKLTARIPEIRSPKDEVKVYIWHRGKQTLYMDDLVVEVREAE